MQESSTDNTTSFVHRLTHGASVHEKIRMLPLVAALALGIILVLTVLFGMVNERRLAAIERDQYPALRLSDSLYGLLVRTQHSLDDASQLRNAHALQHADSLRDLFVASVAGLHGNDADANETRQWLRGTFARYYSQARITAAGGSVPSPSANDRAHVLYVAMSDSLARRSRRQEDAVARAFTRARALQRAAWLLTAIVTLACLGALGALAMLVTRSLTEPLGVAVAVANRLAKGDVRVDIPETGNDEVGQLFRSMRHLVEYLREMSVVAAAIADGELTARVEPRSAEDALGDAFVRMTGYLEEMGNVANEISDGNLTVPVSPRSPRDRFGHSFVAMLQTLNKVINDIRTGAVALSDAAAEIAQSAQRLSTSTNSEADAVARTTARLGQISQSVAESVRSNRTMEDLSQRGLSNAVSSGHAMKEAVAAMQAINKRVSIVGELARDMNLIALNASIEAARAGDEGRAFGVVATEVREIAERCEVAAREISVLTSSSERIVASSGRILGDLVPSIRQTTTLIDTVVASAGTQAAGLTAITSSMGDLAHATQENASAAHHMAATAEEMAAQSETFLRMVHDFRGETSGVPLDEHLFARREA